MSRRITPTSEAISGESLSEDKSERFPADQELRRQGYQIFSRSGSSPALWTKDGKVFRQLNSEGILLEQAKRDRDL